MKGDEEEDLKQLLHDLEKREDSGNTEAVGRIVWRTGFGRGYGPVVQ